MPATPRLFDLEVSKGEIPGYAVATFAGVNPTVGSSFEDLWDAGGNFVFPTAGETWEILSDDANDTNSAGTGARKVLISGLDTDYVEQTETINLNGTSVVTTSRTDWFRIRSVTVIDSGSSQVNEGNITIRVSSGGATRSLIIAAKGVTFNGFFTVPLGKALIFQQNQAIIPKNQDIVIRNKFKVFGSNTFLTGGDNPIYQNSATINFRTPPTLPEKTDFISTVRSTNTEVSVAILFEAKLVSGIFPMPSMSTF